MIRVDAFGPPGVGKSSTIRTLRQSPSIAAHWVLDSAARMVCARRLASQQASAMRRARLRLALKLPKLSELYARMLCNDEQHRALGSYAPSSAFVENSMARVLGGSAPLSLRMKSANDLMFALGQAAVYDRWLSDARVLFDDGSLTHFGTRFAFVDRPLVFAREYCETMPAPDAAIYFNDEPSVIAGRIRQRQHARGMIIPMHAGKTDAELTAIAETCLGMCDAGLRALDARGVPVLRLRVSDGTAVNADKVASLLASLLPPGARPQRL
jgi:hypothetical protein